MSICRKCLLFIVITSASTLFGQTTAHVTFTTIDVPGGYLYNNVGGINSFGVMVGSYSPTNGSGLDKRGFIYDNGVFTYFDYPNAESTFGQGINDSDIVVGSADFSGGLIVHGFFYDGQVFTQFDVPGQPQTFPYGINNAGYVVGSAGDAGSQVKGFRLQNGVYKTITFPGQALIDTASGINNLGQIAGYTINGTPESAYLYNGTFKQIDYPKAPNESRAQGINDSGVAVGIYFIGGGCYGYAYKNGKYLSFDYPGAICTGANGINNAGQVVGQYLLPDFSWHGFVTSPITGADLLGVENSQ